MRVVIAFVLFFAPIVSFTQSPEKPVQQNEAGRETGNTGKQQKTQTHLPSNAEIASTPTTPESQSKADNHQAESDNRVYKVDVVSQPSTGEPLFVPYLIATIVGVVVNAAILFAIWRQTKINWRQVKIGIRAARAARTSARAATASAEIFALSQQPQILVTTEEDYNPWQTFISPQPGKPDYGIRRVVLGLANIGLTAAFDCCWECWTEILPLPFVDFTPNAEHFSVESRFASYPRHDPISLNIPIRREITHEEFQAIFKLKLCLCIRLRVEYRDRFMPSRYAEFGYYVEPRGLGMLPKYNNAN